MDSPSSHKKNSGAKCKACKKRTRANNKHFEAINQVFQLTRQLGNRTESENIEWLMKHTQMPPHLESPMAAPLPDGNPAAPNSLADMFLSVGLNFSDHEIAEMQALMLKKKDDETDNED